jgi:hypothetical protein
MKTLKQFLEAIKYNSDMGVMDWGTPAGTEYMKDVTPGQKNPKKTVAKFKEETEAAETKAEYRDDNAKNAEIFYVQPLSKDDIAEIEYELDSMDEDDMEEYGFFDEDDIDDSDSIVDWDDFDMDDVDIVDKQGLDEVLSIQGRMKRRFNARKNRQKLKVARGIALRRGAAPDRLKKRATRGARSMVYKRLLKGRDRSSMAPAEKARLEKLVGMYQPLIQRFAVRILPKMRKMELSRMKSRSNRKPQKSKKYKAASPVRSSSQKSVKFKVKK